MLYPSELRKDPVSGDWIVIVPKRGKRPTEFFKKGKRQKFPKRDCPFEDPHKSDHQDPMLVINKSGEEIFGDRLRKLLSKSDIRNWSIQVIPNKFPAFIHEHRKVEKTQAGPFNIIKGVGHHEIVVTRDHNKNFPHLSEKEAVEVLRAFQIRYKKLATEECSAYVSIFHNWGPKAGASIYHPHYQIIGIPVIPPDVEHSISGATRYFKKHKKCVHCEIIKFEKKQKNRIIYENKEAIVFAPFISKEPFEIRVFPKKHLPFFEDTDIKDLRGVANALQKVLKLMEKNLQDPDYNFFIHTAPVVGKNKSKHYHWHIEAQPKISISAGFELSTGIEITAVDPDEAAKIIRK